MGAALTYARRYALFTLVGIAGEDDLDAPDLVAPTTPSSGLEPPNGGAGARSNGGAKPHAGYRPPVRRHSRVFPNLPTLGLTPEASAQLRDQLLSQLDAIVDGDRAALWAKRSLPDKNKLTVADAQRVEEAFQASLAGMAAAPEQTDQRSQSHDADPKAPRKQRTSKTIDKSVLALPEPRRIRDRDHVGFVAKQPCLICGRSPRMRITYAMRRAGRSDAKSATSSPSPCAEGTIARSITAAMKRCGGRPPVLIQPLLPGRYGGKRIRWRQAEDEKASTGRPLSPPGIPIDGEAKRSGSADRASSN